ncbi:MAG TPA: bifunctional hydroxymethylpyrimidine kinase/phosphomethylpyrimidine kinase [Gemmatimonadaceae bacterium]|jgi:hydroxymethylpyrimidine/phosphomethylpyrimidine kinase|nr:bifunctional hydroxymethylpyrimidine kinase/phosphomethylpyrimidine kinase [Gemmatimonadaceae bacterium]
MRIALTIAGSDSGGGAGIQADLKTFQRFGVFGTSAITAITAQNTRGVSRWEPVSVDLVRAQIESVCEDLPPSAFKTGMLATAAITSAVAAAIEAHSLANYVLDPVMVATSGDVLVERDAIDAIRTQLMPKAFLVTPNVPEAEILIGEKITDEDGMARAAEKIASELGAQAVLLKGAHLSTGNRVIDVLFDGDIRTFRGQRIETTSTHGTGCTLSAAITARLAKGESLHAAVRRSIQYVQNAIATAPGLGSGNGPLNHLAEDG